MKTFKAVRFQIVDHESVVEYELFDGVIINKEDGSWLLEILIDDIHKDKMENYMNTEQLLDTRVVITRASNDPALFESTIKKIHQLNEKISVVLECHIYTHRQVYAERLLEQLVADGLSGNELTVAFRRMMQSKPKLKDEKQN